MPTTSGCGPSVDRDQLGEVIFTLPKVPGADQPFPMPEPYYSESDALGPQPANAPQQPSAPQPQQPPPPSASTPSPPAPAAPESTSP